MFSKSKEDDCEKYKNQIKCTSFQAEPITYNPGIRNLYEQSQNQHLYNLNQYQENDKLRSAIQQSNWGGSASEYGDDTKIEVTNQISENFRLGAYGTTGGEVGASVQYRFK